jgi:hypothetical protein
VAGPELDDAALVALDGSEGPGVEHVITARDGRLTYRVLAFRHRTQEECAQAVHEALRLGHVREPAPGGSTTVLTSIGR